MPWGQAGLWGLLGLGWALGSGLRGRLWAGPWGLWGQGQAEVWDLGSVGSGPGCGLALGYDGVRLGPGAWLGPGVWSWG